jgi:hypothetical protein
MEETFALGFIDGPIPPSAGQASFDRIAGSLDSMFDFEGGDHDRRLILDPATGAVVDDADDGD